MRACVFISHEGDDHQEHTKLPLNIPKDFDPGGMNWQTKLKEARLTRNKADYDAYPKSDGAWHKAALAIKLDADSLLIVARRYLKSKGCNL
jgi:hypothetical protein